MNDIESQQLDTIPACKGRAVRLRKGQSIKIINVHGSQVVDFWTFNADDSSEFMSMEHLRPCIGRIRPRVGDSLATNRRRPILTLADDTSPGIHDTLMAACDDYRYGLLGCTEYHPNCTDNLFSAARQIGLQITECPSPLNLWMNIPVNSDGETGWAEPVSKPGDYVVFKAELDCVAIMSACPQDILPINSHKPTDAHFIVLS